MVPRSDLTNPIEGSVYVYNTGTVILTQRFLASYSVGLDMRDFPFDTQARVSSAHAFALQHGVPMREARHESAGLALPSDARATIGGFNSFRAPLGVPVGALLP